MGWLIDCDAAGIRGVTTDTASSYRRKPGPTSLPEPPPEAVEPVSIGMTAIKAKPREPGTKAAGIATAAWAHVPDGDRKYGINRGGWASLFSYSQTGALQFIALGVTFTMWMPFGLRDPVR